MSYTLDITDFAETAIEEIVIWYAENETVRRAEKVRNSIYSMIEKIAESPFVLRCMKTHSTPGRR